MKAILPALLTFFLFASSTLSLQAQDCKCEEAFDATVDAYEKDYSLFVYKVTDKNRELYNAHKVVIRSKAEQVTDLSDCKTILEQYLHFFRDGHTYILNPSQTVFHKEKIALSEKQFKKAYKKQNYSLNQVLGIWDNGSYTVAVVPNPAKSGRERDYVGIVLSSTNKTGSPKTLNLSLPQLLALPLKSTS